MFIKKYIINLFFIISITGYAQNTDNENNINLKNRNKELLKPAKVTFYSALLPGLGQFHNKKNWKIPVIYAGLGGSLYYYSHNQKSYQEYRNEYKKRLLGIHDLTDEKFGRLDNNRIIRAQKYHQRNRDVSMVITIGIYILNIIDANVDAHLKQFDIDDDLSIQPTLNINPINTTTQTGILFTYKF